MSAKVEASHDGLRLRVTIDGLPHLHILDTTDLFGVQSWRVARKYFAIEITGVQGAKITLEYDNEALWREVLENLGAALGG